MLLSDGCVHFFGFGPGGGGAVALERLLGAWSEERLLVGVMKYIYSLR